MRFLLAGLALAPSLALSQVQWFAPFSKALPTKPAEGRLPSPNPAVGQPFRLIHASQASLTGDDVEAVGDVHATYKGYDLAADRLTGNRKTQVFRLEGNGRVAGATETVTGQIVTIDFANDTFSFDRGQARIEPGRLEGRTRGPVFLRAEEGSGTSQDILTSKGSFTTCDYWPPHYEITYDTNRVLPGRRLELRGVSLRILGRTLVKLPMLVFPLNRRAPRNLPEVGQSPDEGYYVKTRVTTPLRGDSYVDTRLDYMTKLGAGLGLDYVYTNRSLDGRVSAYTITGGARSKVYTVQHNERLGAGSLNISSSYQLSDYLTAPSSTLWNTSAFYQTPWGNGNTRVTFNRFSSESAGFATTSQTIGLGDDRRFGDVSSRVDFNLSRSDSSGFGSSTRSETFDVRYNASASLRSFTADLVYQRSIPVGQMTNFYSSSDVTPMLTLRTGAPQLFPSGIALHWPFTVEASVGELINPSVVGGEKVTRIAFDLGLRRSEGGDRKWTVDWGSRFRQGLYSDDTAQYVLAYDSTVAYHFGRSSFSAAYNNLRAFGFTPLAIDSTGRNDSFAFDFNYSPSRTLQFAAQTGYDVFQGSVGETPWQFVWLRTKWNPGDWLNLNGSASYDTFNQAWSNLRLDAGVNLGETSVYLGARYDGLRSTWAGLNAIVDGFRLGRLTTNFLLDYNGYSQRFDSQHYQFVYDLHCAEAVFEIIDNQVGFRSGRTLAFFIRLKALPGPTDFGRGTRGQQVGGAGGTYGFGG